MLKRYEAQLGLAHRDLKNALLYAPGTGIIQDRVLEIGDMASPQKAVFTIALIDPLWVRAYVPGFVIGMVEATLITVVAVFWFQVPLVGSLPALYTGLFLFLLSAIGMGLMISSLSVTQQQGLLGAFMFLVPAIILSGFATPILNMPPLVQKLTLINPMRYFMVIVRGVFIEGTPFHLLIGQFSPLAVIGIVTLSIAAWLFRRRMY